jgi:phospholipase A1/A2
MPRAAPQRCLWLAAFLMPRLLHAGSAAPSSAASAERHSGTGEPDATPSDASTDAAAAAAKAADDPELDVLTFHRSNYLVTGFTRDTQVKFQFSIKYDFWPSTSRHTVYFGYSQKSLWDLYATSSPFRESNYAPELFYAHFHSEIHGQPNPGCGLFSEQVGIEHESNGEDSDASRSWNRLFVDVEATCYGKPLYGLLGLRAWYPLGISSNDSIAQTQGYGELVFGLGLDHDASHMNSLVTVAARKGANFDFSKGSLTLDARWRPTYQRLFGKAWKFAPYVWFQAFTGYGETLGVYDQAKTSLRLGVGFTDRAR